MDGLSSLRQSLVVIHRIRSTKLQVAQGQERTQERLVSTNGNYARHGQPPRGPRLLRAHFLRLMRLAAQMRPATPLGQVGSRIQCLKGEVRPELES